MHQIDILGALYRYLIGIWRWTGKVEKELDIPILYRLETDING